MGFEVTGLTQILFRVDGMNDKIMAAVAQAVEQAGEDAAGYARKKAPTNSHGEGDGSSMSLKNSITSQTYTFDGVSAARIRCVAPHAQYVEFGTGIPVGHGGPWVYPIIIDGQQTFRVTSGMPPRPFMAPAMQWGKKTLRAKISRILREGGV